MVNVVARSDGLDPRPPYMREVRLAKGEGSDIQASGYDESSVPETECEALRAQTRSTMWLVCRRKLLVNGNSEPFGAIVCRVIVLLPCQWGRDRARSCEGEEAAGQSPCHSTFNRARPLLPPLVS